MVRIPINKGFKQPSPPSLPHTLSKGKQNFLGSQGWCCGCGNRRSSCRFLGVQQAPADRAASTWHGNSERTGASAALQDPPPSRNRTPSISSSSPLHTKTLGEKKKKKKVRGLAICNVFTYHNADLWLCKNLTPDYSKANDLKSDGLVLMGRRSIR